MAETPTGKWAEIRDRFFNNSELQEESEHTKHRIVLTRQMLSQIDAERQRAGLSKAELARRIGTSPSVISRVFSSEASNPTLRTILEMLDVLGMTVELKSNGKTADSKWHDARTDLSSFIEPLKKVKPKQIILFGSYAYGTPSVDSDVDLLVIMETEDAFYQRIQKLRPLLPEDKAVDLIVLTPEEFQKSKSTNPLVREIAEKGKVMYG